MLYLSMKNLILLICVIPIIGYSQLKLDDLFSVKSETDFKRTMIENGFNSRQDSDPETFQFIYKPTYNYNNELSDFQIISFYSPSDTLTFQPAYYTLLFSKDYKGESEIYDSLYDVVKKDCEFSDIRGDLAFYRCKDSNPDPEIISFDKQLMAIGKAMGGKPDGSFSFSDIEIGFGGSGDYYKIYQNVVSLDDIGLSILGSLKDELSENFTEDDLKAFEEGMRLGEKLMDSLPELQIDN